MGTGQWRNDRPCRPCSVGGAVFGGAPKFHLSDGRRTKIYRRYIKPRLSDGRRTKKIIGGAKNVQGAQKKVAKKNWSLQEPGRGRQIDKRARKISASRGAPMVNVTPLVQRMQCMHSQTNICRAFMYRALLFTGANSFPPDTRFI